jgi:two-component system sensor kinase FixL
MNYVEAARRTLCSAGQAAVTRAQEIIAKASKQILRADSIIRNLREFTEKRECKKTRESLNKVVEEAVALGFVGTTQGGVKIQLDLDPALPPVLIDRVQIQQVLINLIRNSIEAMHASDKRVLSLATGVVEPGFVQVAVRDTGPGLSGDVIRRLFQPFVTTKDNGMGIGLTICQSIIDAHGGTIWTVNGTSPGADFRFRLPLARAGGAHA